MVPYVGRPVGGPPPKGLWADLLNSDKVERGVRQLSYHCRLHTPRMAARKPDVRPVAKSVVIIRGRAVVTKGYRRYHACDRDGGAQKGQMGSWDGGQRWQRPQTRLSTSVLVAPKAGKESGGGGDVFPPWSASVLTPEPIAAGGRLKGKTRGVVRREAEWISEQRIKRDECGY